MSRRDPVILLEDMARAVSSCLEYTEGMTFEAFSQDRKTVDAICRCLQVLGEAAKRLPEEIITEAPQLPWPQIRGLRNRIVHEYFDINLERTWLIIQEELPKLLPQLKAILSSQDR